MLTILALFIGIWTANLAGDIDDQHGPKLITAPLIGIACLCYIVVIFGAAKWLWIFSNWLAVALSQVSWDALWRLL